MSEADNGVVAWEDPEVTPTRYDWSAIAEQLRLRPGQWAKIWDEGPTSTVNAIRSGKVLVFRPADGSFEISTRNNVREPRRTCTFYMRFNPKEGE